jgi:hypothetical protein
MFPNVPNVPGVPALSRDPFIVVEDVLLLVSDAISFLSGFGQPQWGIYLDGIPVIPADSVVSVEYRNDFSIADFPLEQGAFESYDKVSSPFSVRVRFAQGGSQSARQNFLDSIAEAAQGLDLYDVVTPEQVYTSVNISHYDFKRSAQNGAGLIMVDVWLTEIRVTATAEFSNTKSPTSASPVNNGSVQSESANAGVVTRGQDLPNISGPLSFQ